MNSSSQQPEGTDGDVVLYRERLWPGVGICAFLSLMTVSLGIAYGHAYGTMAGFVVGVLSTTLLIGSMFLNSPIVQVDNLVVRAGKARLPLRFVGDLKFLDTQATRSAIRGNVHHQAYLLVRTWTPNSVLLTVTDTTDPHPYWHISSRDSKALLSAIETAKITYGGPDGQKEKA